MAAGADETAPRRDSVVLDASELAAREIGASCRVAQTLAGRVLAAARALGMHTDLDGFLEGLARAAGDLVPCGRAAAYLAPPAGGSLARGGVWARDGAGEAPVSGALSRAALGARRALWVESVAGDAQFRGRPSLARARAACAVAAGIPVPGGAAGLLYADSREPGALTAEHAAALESLAQEVGPVLDRLRRLDLARRALEASRGAPPAAWLSGESAAIARLRRDLARLAAVDAPVLILGETGSGKERVARALHAGGARAQGPFVAVNCAAVVPTLFESDLFGHERGAFTGAVDARPGRFEQADGGILLLDEVGELAMPLQAKLLRALEEKAVWRVGARQGRPVDVRVLAATNRDLKGEVAAGRFREDLFFRLAVVTVEVPPLRERGDDVLRLAREIVPGGPGGGVPWDDAFAAALLRYRWPGNVRELSNVLQRAGILAGREPLRVEHLPPEFCGPVSASDPALLRTLDEVESEHIRRVLASTGGKKGEAARILGISWPTLNRKLGNMGDRDGD